MSTFIFYNLTYYKELPNLLGWTMSLEVKEQKNQDACPFGGFEPPWVADTLRIALILVNNVTQITLQLRVFGRKWGIRTPGAFYTPSAFKADSINRTLPTLQNISTHCFALAILPSLLKPAIHAVAHVFIGFEPIIIHYQWIYNWICCMRHVNFTDSWLWSPRWDSNSRPTVPGHRCKNWTCIYCQYFNRIALC